MKNKYDIIQAFILFIISMIIVLIISINSKITTYKTYSLIHLNNNKYEIIISEKDLKLFNQTKSIYINNIKYKYKIIEINSNIKQINNTKYNDLIIEISKYKSNDNIIECSIIYKRIRLIHIFTSIYK